MILWEVFELEATYWTRLWLLPLVMDWSTHWGFNQKAVKLSGLLYKFFILIYEELCFKCNQTHGSYHVCILLHNEALNFFHMYFSWLINVKT